MTTAAEMGWTLPAVYASGPGWAVALRDAIDAIAADFGTEHNVDGTHKAYTAGVNLGDAITVQAGTFRANTAFKKGATEGYIFVLADKDGDGDFDPLSASAWLAQPFAHGASGTINWNTAFGVPTTAKAVTLIVTVGDAADLRDQDGYIELKAKSTTLVASLVAEIPKEAAKGQYRYCHGVVPIAADGTSYYYIGTRGTGEYLTVTIRVVGYYI